MSSEKLDNIRHSLAHLLAAAVLDLYPNTKLTLGPAIDTGFYYDFGFAEPLKEDELPKIEKTMRKIAKSWKSFEKSEVTTEEAKNRFSGNPYKLEMIDEIVEKGEPITLYTSGEFTDLCKGGHVEDFSDVSMDAWKLDRVAGAYWRGDEKNTMLTRIYGLAFEGKEKLEEYLEQREEAEKRDHRKLGKELEIFMFNDAVGAGLPIWLPNGEIIRHELEKWARETEKKWGYEHVVTPHITKKDLFEISGHLPYYKDDLYAPIEIEGEEYYLKPMNCPFTHMIYKNKQRSYRDLPIRLAEYGQVYRFERSGVLHGLMRARGFCQNDAHIYVQPEKAVEEFTNVIKMHEYYYEKLGIIDWWVMLGTRDPKNLRAKYHGDDSMWEEAERLSKEALDASGVKYDIEEGGAAHYGPKADIYIRSAIGKEYAIGTDQIDLYMPERFALEYIDNDGKAKMPYIIHRAPLGSHERMIGFLLEHYAGAFPLWLAPVQIAVIPVNPEVHGVKTKEIIETLKKDDFRVKHFDSHDTLGKRIREIKTHKIPYSIIVGDKDLEAGKVTLESRDKGQIGQMPTEEVQKLLEEERNNRT